MCNLLCSALIFLTFLALVMLWDVLADFLRLPDPFNGMLAGPFSIGLTLLIWWWVIRRLSSTAEDTKSDGDSKQADNDN